MFRKAIFPSLAFCLVLLGDSHLQAEEPAWKVGLAQVKITPRGPLTMAGYGGRSKPHERVADDLYAKAMVLEDRAGNRAVIITTDLIGFRAACAEPLCVIIGKKTGLKREQILINSSHTHAGPHLTLDPESRDYGQSAEMTKQSMAYTVDLLDKVTDVVVKALGDLQPATFSIGSGFCSFVMNRREFTPTGIKLGNNFRGLADRSVPMLRVDGADGKPRCVLFGAASHNTTLGGDNLAISGDYAGAAQQFLQEKLPGVQAMFMLGCAGAANPYPRGTFEHVRVHGASLGQEVERLMATKLAPIRGPLAVSFDYVDIPLRTAYTPTELAELAKGSGQSWTAPLAKRIQEAIDKGEKLPTHYRAPIAVWQFGQDLTLVALSGEVVVDYVTQIERAIGPLNLWVAAYSNDVFGYLPSAQVLAEGGYETRGLIHGGYGMFAPEAETAVVEKVRELAKRVGRKMP